MELILKNPRIKPADNGGYIVEYEKCMKNTKDSFDGTSYVGSGTEVFESGSDAIKRLDEIQADVTKITFAALEAQEHKKEKEKY